MGIAILWCQSATHKNNEKFSNGVQLLGWKTVFQEQFHSTTSPHPPLTLHDDCWKMFFKKIKYNKKKTTATKTSKNQLKLLYESSTSEGCEFNFLSARYTQQIAELSHRRSCCSWYNRLQSLHQQQSTASETVLSRNWAYHSKV